MTTRTEIVAVARELLGPPATPWRHQGRIKLGVDCVGLLLYTARKCGITGYEPPPYRREAEWGKFVQYFRDNMVEIRIWDAKPGDALVFRQKTFPCHCGLMTQSGDNPYFIHAYLPQRRVIEERFTAGWKRQCMAAFRFSSVSES